MLSPLACTLEVIALWLIVLTVAVIKLSRRAAIPGPPGPRGEQGPPGPAGPIQPGYPGVLVPITPGTSGSNVAVTQAVPAFNSVRPPRVRIMRKEADGKLTHIGYREATHPDVELARKSPDLEIEEQ